MSFLRDTERDEAFFHKYDADRSAELERHIVELAREREAATTVKCDRRLVIVRYQRDDIFYSVIACCVLYLIIKCAADVLVPTVGVDIDRERCGTAIGAACVENIEIGISDRSTRFIARDKKRMARRYALDTSRELRLVDGLLLDGVAGALYIIIEDLGSAADIGGAHERYGYHPSILSVMFYFSVSYIDIIIPYGEKCNRFFGSCRHYRCGGIASVLTVGGAR